MKRRICVVITARASYARIKTALHGIQAHPDLELKIVVAASAVLNRFGDAADFIEGDGFEISAKVFSIIEGETPLTSAKSTGLGLIELSSILESLKPDAVVTIADRYETIATAIAASYMNIPLVHIQGGEVTGSIDEKVRHAITKMADLHCVSTERAKDRVLRMGELPERVHVTGCPSIDLAREVLESLPESEANVDWAAELGGVGPDIDIRNDYVLAMQHPVPTEYGRSRKQAEDSLEAVRQLDMPVLWFWPNPDAGSDDTSKAIRMFRARHPDAPFHFFRNVSPENFVRLARGARVLVGNSSFGIRESSFIGLPVVNIGSRQQDRERAVNVCDVGYSQGEILAGLRKQLAHGPYPSDDLYGRGRAGETIAEILASAVFETEKKLAY